MAAPAIVNALYFPVNFFSLNDYELNVEILDPYMIKP